MKNGLDMNGLNGIIIEGKCYEVVDRGTFSCKDCDLYERCHANGRYAPACVAFGYDRNIFRFSQTLTDKINEK
ncbi:MAG: hypothetical protein K2M59_03800 [Muribaculaceae bacterium]|nr:hypothetical protein [Muribaculaceae bacterium]MDE7465534.1 hypothetical protein [Muribaculaceae bacterium]